MFTFLGVISKNFNQEPNSHFIRIIRSEMELDKRVLMKIKEVYLTIKKVKWIKPPII